MNDKYKLVSDKDKVIGERKNFHIIGIGASAGGLEALESFFSNVTGESKFAFVVVLHLSPDYKSLMAQLLSKHTDMDVHNVENGVKVEPNNVYLIPPQKTMTISKGVLYLHEKKSSQIPTFTIDIFFKSLAEEKSEQAIGIILSGTGSDGTKGVKMIKEVGGMVMVQSPENAKFDGMPRNGIATGLVDYVLPAHQMPEELVNYVEHPLNRPETVTINKEEYTSEDSLVRILKTIRQVTGIDFSNYKRDTILRRIQRRLTIRKFEDLTQYADFLKEDKAEVRIVQKELLIGVTKFFRDDKVFKYLEQTIIPQIFESATNNRVRVWVPACSTGEEAYSIAILLMDYQSKLEEHYDVKIFATDVDQDAVLKAGLGRFQESVISDIPKDRLNRYFIKHGEEYQVTRSLRDLIIFTTHDIIKDPPFNKLDLISCRNLLIYFQSVLQRKILKIFNFSLNRNAFLLLGNSESADDLKTLFATVNNKYKVYRSLLNTKLLNVQDYSIPQQKSRAFVPQSDYTPAFHVRPGEQRELKIISDLLTSRYTASCFLLDENSQFLRYFGSANKYLRLPERLDDLDITRMVHEDLAIPLSTAIKRAMETKTSVQYKDVLVQMEHEKEILTLSISPYVLNTTRQTLLAVIIEEQKEGNVQVGTDAISYDVSSSAKQRIQDLEQELKTTRENLQATIEELQTSNEELIAANEELQSTNEELQSVNEELYTINSEHQASILELTELNDDVNNLLQSTEIGTLFLDSQLRIRKFNQSITEQVNITEIDIGRPIEHFATKIIYSSLVDDAKQVIKTLIPIQKEIQSRSGIWYLMRIMPYRTAENQIKGTVITFVDINELKEAEQLKALTNQLQTEVENRKQAELAVLRQNEEFRVIFNALPDLYFRIDENGMLMDVKIGRHNHYKIDPESAKGKNVLALMESEVAANLIKEAKEALASQQIREFNYTREIAKEKRFYEGQLVPVENKQIIAIIRDMTDYVNAKVKILEQKKDLALFFEGLPDLYFRMDYEGVYVDVRTGPFFMPFAPLVEVVGSNIVDVLPIPAAEVIKNAVQVTIDTQEPGICIFDIEKRGKQINYECRLMPSVAGQAIGVVRDVSELTQRENELKELANSLTAQKRMLETSNAALEQFAYSTSHDLKEPLRSISSFSQLLGNRYEKKLGEEGMEYVEFISKNARRMHELVEGILSYARIGQEKAQLELISTNAIIDQVLENLSESVIDSNALIETGELPEVYAEENRLLRVFQNLIANAIKFRSEERPLAVKISSQTGKNNYTFSVADNGKGINMSYKDHIFQMFKQLNSSDRFKGSGVGLSICKRIIEDLGGEIWVQSEIGKGSTFYFKIPIDPEVDEE